MIAVWLAAMVGGAHAGEGMWLPEQMPEVAAPFVEQGLQIDPAELADPMGAPLGSIVTLGFCSASFVSPDGLVVTNHHCVEGFLQYISTGEANHHRDGFVAPTRADEAHAGPSARLGVVTALTDVTSKVMDGIGKRTKDADRHDRMEANRKALVADCEATPNRRCRVVPHFGGATWRLVEVLEIQDVRLVYVPPMSLGQYGGDVDNWMWPRHGADFAFLRAYVAPDGSSAPYSEDNVPYQPAQHLLLGEGVSEDDVVMVAGFPGSTERHLLTMDLAWQAETVLPQSLEGALEALEIMERHAEADPEAAARLGARISGYRNFEKNTRGMLAGVAGRGVLEAKQAQEDTILAWIDADKKRAKTYRKAHTALTEALVEEHLDADRLRAVRWIQRASGPLGFAYQAVRWADERETTDDAERDSGYQDRDRDRTAAWYAQADRGWFLPADRELLQWALGKYADAPAETHLPSLDAWLEAQGGVGPALDALYAEPKWLDADARVATLDTPAADLRGSGDPWIGLAVALEDFFGPRREAREATEGKLQRLFQDWMTAKLAWADATDTLMYDDANSTLRITIGTVTGYVPQDGLVATPFTTTAGMAAKAGDAPFDAPADVLARVPDAASSRWAVEGLGDVPVDFLSTLDITGGNSGSAVLDGQGRLVGLAFDGNWESIAADWWFLDDVTRCISVDLRYVLWLLDGDEGAAGLRDELGVGAP